MMYEGVNDILLLCENRPEHVTSERLACEQKATEHTYHAATQQQIAWTNAFYISPSNYAYQV